MRRFLALAVLSLGGCNAPLGADWSTQYFDIERSGQIYQVRTQYDPIDFAWYSRVSQFGGRLEKSDVNLAVKIVEQGLGPKICNGNAMTISPDGVRGLNEQILRYLPENGAWHIVAQCT